MFKENARPPPEDRTTAAAITDDQRARITRNFRAAKALLARKRPLDFSPPLPSPKCSVIDASNPRSIRVPLSDIHNGSVLQHGFSTPVKPLGICTFQAKDATPSSSIFDDELDDSFLEEVDTICEQLPSAQKYKPNSEEGRNGGDLNFDSMPKKYYDYLQSLNDAQREAACSTISIPLMIVAGPGSGKTSTMVGRVLTLLKEGIGPANILAMTFTTAAASEMRDRIGAVVGKAVAKDLAVGTFHSFCLQLCRLHAEKLGRTAEFLIYGHGHQRRAVIEAMRLMTNEEKKMQELKDREELNNDDIAQSLKVNSKKWLKVVIQKRLLEQRAIIDVESGKYLNEDGDPRSALQYLLDDASNFLYSHYKFEDSKEGNEDEGGCVHILKSFLDYISMRESENFRSRRQDNDNSVMLTTIHQSKGLEWDIVFIIKANDSEIPLLHEFNGAVQERGAHIEEERRLFYVAMTRARKKLYILYNIVDCNWKVLLPSRFLKEIPGHLVELQGETQASVLGALHDESVAVPCDSKCAYLPEGIKDSSCEDLPDNLVEMPDSFGNDFLKSFSIDERLIVSHLFHQWAKKRAFQHPKRLLDKVNLVIDERLRSKTYKHKNTLRALKSYLSGNEAFYYAQYVLRWEQMPIERRTQLMREKQEHFQKQRIENSMGSTEATSKQVAFLRNLGCTIVPTSRLHASRLIEQYKSL
ncbi:hypothetical protein KSP39_PZI022682 [Platanthera zijinensis]|uniref:DNA 3'-5' helicase n=1 Tax=Platanthera zijinensis TaxID=2320716 RepID=A0AAP0FV43_9ASPA